MIPEQAIKILNKVKESIRRHPEEFDMDSWDCGTTACIAGWIGRHAQEICIGSRRAAELLGVPHEAAYGLWFLDHWPDEVYKAYVDAPCCVMRVEAACKAIDAFVEDPGQFYTRVEERQ